MSRLWLPVRRWVFLGLATVALLVVLTPLRVGAGLVGLDRLGVSARQMTGLIWSGKVIEGRVGPLPLGRLDVALNPLALLIGQGRLSFAGHPRATAPAETGLTGRVIGRRGGSELVGVSGSVEVGGLVGGLPAGLMTLTDFGALWEAGRCQEATGRVRLDLNGPVAGLPLGSLSGAPRCDGGALLLPLASGTGAERLDVRLDNGGAKAALVVRSDDAAAVPLLAAAGFRPAAEGYTLPLAIGGGR